MLPIKRSRKEVIPSGLPPVAEALAGDSASTIGFDFTYESLQSSAPSVPIPNVYPISVMYEFVALIPRTQGVDLKVFAYGGCSSTLSSVLLTFSVGNNMSLTLAPGWLIGVQTKQAIVSPGSAKDSRLVYDVDLTVNADNVASANSNIIRGSFKTGTVQDFTGNIEAKVDSTTVLAKNRIQEACVKKPRLRMKLLTRLGTVKFNVLSEAFESFTFTASGSMCFYANWAKTYLTPTASGLLSPMTMIPANATFNVPYGVIPTICISPGMQAVVVLLQCTPSGALTLVFMAQPMEGFGLSPLTAGTWVATILFGASSLSTVNVASSLVSIGQVRMFCPTSIPTVIFAGLDQNFIYANGSAYGLAPSAVSNSETYGFRPPMLDDTCELIDFIGLQTVDKKTECDMFSTS